MTNNQTDTTVDATVPQATSANGRVIIVPQKNEPVRRVGSFTIGVAMIGYGLFFAICLLFDLPIEAVVYSFKFAPFILVFLGVETLLYNIIFNNQKLKYDFISFAITFFLIGGVAIATVVAAAFQYLPQHF